MRPDSRWQTIRTPDGKDLWLKMDTRETQYTSPFVAEIMPNSSVLAEEPTPYWGEATEPANAVVRPEVVVVQPPVDQPTQVRDSLTKTVPKARIIPNRIVMSTSGAQYDRWKQATSKELQAFLKTAWKEPTPEVPSRYFASKKKVVMQLLVFSQRQPKRRHKDLLATNMRRLEYVFRARIMKASRSRTPPSTPTLAFSDWS